MSRPLKILVPKDSQGKSARLAEGFLDSEVNQTERVQSYRGTSKICNLCHKNKINLKDSHGRPRIIIAVQNVRNKSLVVV